ncbi:tail fiber domain-containing protein [Bacteroides cellulosilyticus]|uniref:tail fiber domain-containing protein n=1 Tax=Bacteroides cellulosilyticus TaxID=246787 RepID=UPI0032EBD9B9
MQFTRTNINKTFRNGVVNASNVAVTNVGGGGGSSSLSGNFLPAVNNGDGSYTVDLSKVVFTGNLIGEGEITAYGQGSTGGGSTSTGSVTIYDGLDSVAVDAALSANQGRILREMILEAGTGGSTLLSKLEDVTLTNLADGQILKYDATSKKWVNGDGTKVTWTNIEGKPAALTDANIAKWNENSHTHTNKTTLDKITEANLTSWNNKLDKAIWDKAFYFDSAGDLRAKVNVIGEKEISAYGAGTTSGAGTVTIVDALTSTATDCALSANMGRILKDMIDSKGAVSSWEDITDKPSWITSTKPSYSWNEITGKPSTFTPSEHTHNYASSVKVGNTAYNAASNVISLPAYPTLSSLSAVSSTDFNAHTGNTTLHITSTERTNWNDANSKKHTHSNKSVLDGITSAKVTNWDGVVTNWNKAFYFDSNGDLKVKVNVIGEKEISAYGAGASGGSGSITIVDALTSTATDAALSANQGRILRELIDSKGEGGVTNWADLEGKPSWIGASKPSYNWDEIGSKPSTFTPSTHTHNYASTVKVGSTSYNVSGNTISLPAYPTVPSALKNPNALTISLNGTSQGAYDGSAAKSFNITAASVGAAASSHSHSISNVSGLQDALNGKAASSHNHNSSYVSALGTNGNYLTWTKNGTTNNITVPYASNSDKLDGMNHTDFESYKLVTIDASGLNNNTWYPVTMVIGNSQQTRIRIEGNTNANATWNSRSDKNMALILDYTVNGSQWGWTQVVRTIHAYQEGAGTSSCLRGLGQLTNSSTEYVYVRGGAKYNFYVSRFITPTLRTSSYTASSQSVAPTTSAPAAISRNVAYISDTVAAANKVTNSISFAAGSFGTKSYNGSTAVTVNVPTHTSHLTNNSGFITSSASISGNAGSATKLQTARTINGTSFNGTANITTANWGTTRSIYIQDATATNTSSAVSVNGGDNAYLKLPTNIKVDTLTATGEVTAYSDIRLKTDIQPLENRGYIKPVTYKKDGKDSIGFIAQEVREVYPELVIEDNTEDKYLSVNYAQYVAVLQAQIIDLKREIDELKNIKTK